MTDLEIAHSVQPENIIEVAKKLNIENCIEQYGCDKAKINVDKINIDKKGKLILVTSINPTPYGEGKTTLSIGLNDGLRKLNKSSVAVLREPSLGPVFGLKGGATGGGYSQVIPMEDINLHFTGDFHSISSANNLISSVIDNHLYFDNELNLDENNILWKRTIDLNDRALRDIKTPFRKDSFQITAASEMMSILCLSKDLADLKNKVDNILIGFTKDNKPVYAKELKVSGSVALLLKDAIKPNLVQSLEHNPVIIHGGPFANISTGCNSIIATTTALKISDYVVTEAGFGSDLGAEKFFDIKCRKANLKPDCVVIVITIKALKHHGSNDLQKGIDNLKIHIENMLKYTSHVVVALNEYNTDTKEEIDYVSSFVNSMNVSFEINNSWKEGSNGSLSLASTVIEECNKPNDFKLLYNDDLSITDKIKIITKEIYRADDIIYSDSIKEKIEELKNLGYSNLPICIAKTQYSLSDDKDKLGYPKNYSVTIKDIKVLSGAGFIVVYLGKILTMPGLSKQSNYENIDINNGIITGLF